MKYLGRTICLTIIAIIGLSLVVFAAPIKKAPNKTQKKNTIKAVGKKVQATDKNTAEAKSSGNSGNSDMSFSELKDRVESLKRENDDAKLSGEIRFSWTKNVENTSIKNNFDITRAYLTVKKKLDRGASARVTLDVSRLSPSSTTPQSLFDYLKYAYVELPIDVPFSFNAKIGLQQTVWIDWAEKIWGNPYIMKQYEDNEGIMPSSDFGIGAIGRISLPNVPGIEYHATVLNGGGYKVAESDSAKDIAVRFNSEVYSSDSVGRIVVGGYINSKAGIFNSGSINTKQAGVLLGLINRYYGNAYIEYMRGTNSNGCSIGGFVCPAPQTLPGVCLLARVDNYDPDTTSGNNEIKRTLVGTSYDWGRDVRMALDLQTYQQGSNAIQKTAYLHTVIYF